MVAAVVALLALTHPASAPWSTQAVSGAPQSAPAFAAPHAEAYIAAFAHPLKVRLRGRHGASVAVRFWCASAGCTFPPSDQGDEVTRVDPRSYDVKAAKGAASLEVTLQVPTPGDYVVMAAPVVNGKPRPAQGTRFVLTVR